MFWDQSSTPLFTLNFTLSASSVTVTSKLTSNATGIVNGVCSAPLQTTNFSTMSSQVWLYFTVQRASVRDSAQIQFMRPDGVVYTSFNSTISSVGNNGFECFSYSINISGTQAASFP